MKKLTTAQVAKRLGVAQVTVNVWCIKGRFPHAVREETPRGPVWMIPEGDLKGFERPKLGRPRKAQKRAKAKQRSSKRT
jgi:Helix-turn-helix domain